MSKRVQKWALPDHVVVVESLPKSSAGKILKSEVRILASSILLDAKAPN
jgi:acyl-coenzyme A synthetase/AMP-(fatty) acid ligase